MRQAITVTRHKNLWSSSSYSEAEKRGIVFKSAENTNTSHAKICYTWQWMAQSGFFIIINTLASSVPPLDQESRAKVILSCASHSNTTGWQQARGRPFPAALFSLTPSAKGHYQQNSRASRASGAWPAACITKITRVWGVQKVSTSPEGISGCFLTTACSDRM